MGRKRIGGHEPWRMLDDAWRGGCGGKPFLNFAEAAGLGVLGDGRAVMMVRQRNGQQRRRHHEADGRAEQTLDERWTFHGIGEYIAQGILVNPIFPPWTDPQPLASRA